MTLVVFEKVETKVTWPKVFANQLGMTKHAQITLADLSHAAVNALRTYRAKSSQTSTPASLCDATPRVSSKDRHGPGQRL